MLPARNKYICSSLPAHAQHKWGPNHHFFSICNTRRVGHHVPFLVKLPSFLKWFSRLPQQKYFDKYRAGSPGVFNGLYYFPDGKSTQKFEVPDVVTMNGPLNLTQSFLKTDKYKLLQYIATRVVDNLDIHRHGYIDLKVELADFRNSTALLNKSKFFKIN